jgi:hypothetical protein
VVVGDDPDAFIVDLRTRAPVMRLSGHLDYSFAASWQPEAPHIVATGNQAGNFILDVNPMALPNHKSCHSGNFLVCVLQALLLVVN